MTDTIEDLLYATLDMGEDVFAPMSLVWQLAKRWSDHEDTAAVLATLEGLADDEAFRIRNVVLIALRNIGETGRACDPQAYERITLAGLKDEKANVRLYAAWLAGSFAMPGSTVHAALKEMAAELGTPEADSQEAKTLQRAHMALAEIEARGAEA